MLLTKEDMEDALLPAGNLRESLAALQEADVIVLREEEMACDGGVRGAAEEGGAGSAAVGDSAAVEFCVRREDGYGGDLPCEAAGVLRDCAAGRVCGDAARRRV